MGLTRELLEGSCPAASESSCSHVRRVCRGQGWLMCNRCNCPLFGDERCASTLYCCMHTEYFIFVIFFFYVKQCRSRVLCAWQSLCAWSRTTVHDILFRMSSFKTTKNLLFSVECRRHNEVCNGVGAHRAANSAEAKYLRRNARPN